MKFMINCSTFQYLSLSLSLSLCRSLEKLRSLRPGPVQHLVEVIFGGAPLATPDPRLSQLEEEEQEKKKEEQSSGGNQEVCAAMVRIVSSPD